MGRPSRPKTQDFKASEPLRVTRDPSYPDRDRIDSDVRAFMRPVSTPWIVFDRDSRVDNELAFAAKAAMRAGVAFMSSPDLAPVIPTAASRLADINAMFPPSVPQQKTNDEPSSLIVAADVVPTDRQASLPDVIPGLTKKSRVGLIAASLGAVGVCSIAAYIVAAVQAAPPPVAAVEAPIVAAVAPPAESIPAPEPIAEAPVEQPAAAPAEVVGENATDPKKRWGKLTIKSDATKKQVWFDGKRMLGSGNRTFMVYCGMHTVAVTEKTDSKDMEVPCNGELVVGK